MRLKIIAPIIILLLSTLPALSIELVIDFEKAMDLAMKQNKQIRMLKADNEYANLQVKEAYSGAMPVINAIGSYSRYLVIPEMESDFVMDGKPVSFKMALGRKNNYYGSITLDQPLWIAGKIGIAIKIAKLYKEVAEKRVALGEDELKLQVTQVFYGVIVAAEFMDLTKQTENQIESHLRNAKAMFEEGVISEYALLRAEVELANFHPTVTASREAYKMAMEGLRIVLGLEPEEGFTVQGRLEDISPETIELEQALEIAYDSRPDLQQISLQKEMFDQLLQIEQRNQYWPSFFLSLAYTRQAQDDNFEFDNYFWGDGVSAGISVAVPLFDGFKTKSRVQMAKINLKKNGLLTMQVRDGIRMEIKSALSRIYEAQDKLNASQKAVMQAEKGYRIAEVRYQEGISTQVELLDARLAQTQAQTSELAAKYELIVAEAEFNKAIGR